MMPLVAPLVATYSDTTIQRRTRPYLIRVHLDTSKTDGRTDKRLENVTGVLSSLIKDERLRNDSIRSDIDWGLFLCQRQELIVLSNRREGLLLNVLLIIDQKITTKFQPNTL